MHLINNFQTVYYKALENSNVSTNTRMKLFGLGNKSKYSSKDILSQLDKCAEEFTFPMLDNGYVYPVESRLTAYRDDKRWVLIIEAVGFNYRGGGHDGITNCLHIFGNCILFKPGTDNSNFLYMMDNSEEGETFDSEFMEHLNPSVNSMLLRNKRIKIEHNLGFYESKGIQLEEPPKIKIWEFLRGLVPEYSMDLLATDDELRNRVPSDIPEFLRLTEWFHPDLASDEKPSQNETFIMIAKALATGDKSKYTPTKPPNNHWTNWPEGGTL
jgi:hypothetical protein